jgi:hypothetical protein
MVFPFIVATQKRRIKEDQAQGCLEKCGFSFKIEARKKITAGI